MDLPSDDALRWIVTRYARLLADHGAALGTPVLLEPTGKHFPDAFERDAESVDRLLRRMIGYTPLHEDVGVTLRFVEQAGGEDGGGGGCGTGGCGTSACGPGDAQGTSTASGVIEVDDGYLVDLNVGDTANVTRLTSSLARSVGSLVLAEAGDEDAGDAGASELAAIACGFGVLLLDGAHIYGKSCGGVRVHQATSLGLMETAVALGLFLRVHGLRPGAARAHLHVTQTEALDKAMEWVDSNETLVTGLRDNPDPIGEGLFSLEPVRGFFGRLFGKKSDIPELTPLAPKRKTARTPEEQRKHDELRAIVDEALSEHRAGSRPV